MEPRLSVAIAARNAAATIRVQLDALAAQSWSEPWEVVVADNASTDETRAIIESYVGRIPSVRVVEAHAYANQSYARNTAALAARAPIIAFCDADDEVAPDWVERMWEAVSRHEFVACRLEYERLNPPWVLGHRETQLEESLQDTRFAPHLQHGAGCGLGFLRRHYDAVGGFDERAGVLDDTDFCFKVQLAGVPLHYARDAVVHYRFRTDIRGIFRQARNYATDDAFLQLRYGPPPRSLGYALRWPFSYWQALARLLPGARTRAGRAKLAWLVGWMTGRYRGSLRYRILAR